MSSFDLDQYRKLWQPRIDAALTEILEELGEQRGCPDVLFQAMQHAVLGGGKRLRPLLCLAAARACGGEEESALYPSCALELIHAYSLVHDDLPSMDDDDVRRGQPSCHKAFGEALAILTGDALLTQAFSLLAGSLPAPIVPRAVELVARGAGATGMVGGQVDDVQADDGERSLEAVEFVHLRKTAALFVAALHLGGLVAGASPQQMDALFDYGQALGLAYQITDDLLAQQGDPQALGRPAGSDRSRRTHPVVAGAEGSRGRAVALVKQAVSAIGPLGGKADALLAVAGFVEQRSRRQV